MEIVMDIYGNCGNFIPFEAFSYRDPIYFNVCFMVSTQF